MSRPKVRFPIGVSDFLMLREAGSRYVDKSLLIEDIVDAGAQVLLFPRPRRFGKTLNLSMLRIRRRRSYHDTGGDNPERVDHAFIVGLLVSLGPRYEVRSNRESGYGRYDVMVLPRTAGEPGLVLELKTIDAEAGETKDTAIADAFRQIREKEYATELRERGAHPVHELAAVFDGKRAWVKKA